VQATDYGAWGDVLREQKSDTRKYRFGYQGQYARDEETGWGHFELREYDVVVGRWTSKDPAGQYFSPYIGMGNNPVTGMDVDGGEVLTDIYDKNTGAKLMHIDDNIDQAIAMSFNQFELFLMVGQINNYGANVAGISLGTNTDFELISNTLYEEAGYRSPLAEESAAIYDVLENRANIRNKSVVDIIKTTGVYGYSASLRETTYDANRLKTARLGAIMGITTPNNVEDYSRGSYFWDGSVYLENPKTYPTNFFNRRGHGDFVGTDSKSITFSYTKKIGATQFMNYNKSIYPNKVYP